MISKGNQIGRGGKRCKKRKKTEKGKTGKAGKGKHYKGSAERKQRRKWKNRGFRGVGKKEITNGR